MAHPSEGRAWGPHSTVAWRDRAPKVDPGSRCCWVCGKLGGDGFSTALRYAGYRMPHGMVAHAHARCMSKANAQHEAHVQKMLAMRCEGAE